MAKYPRLTDDWIFREEFRSIGDLVENGGDLQSGTISGGTYTGDGSDGIQYLMPELGTLFGSGFTVMAKINVSDDDGDAVGRRMFSYHNGDFFSFQLSLRKSDDLMVGQVRVDGTVNGHIADSYTFTNYDQDLWMVLTWDGTALRGYEDSTQVLSDSAAGTASLSIDTGHPGVFQIADNSVGSWNDDIKEVRIYNRALDTSELSAIVNETTFNFLNETTISLPLKSNYNDGADQVTDNIGLTGGTFRVGDGSTASTFPAQLTEQGMSFDGGDWLDDTGSTLPALGTDDFTFEALVRTETVSQTNADMVGKGNWGATTAVRASLNHNSTNWIFLAGTAGASFGPVSFGLGRWSHLVGVRDANGLTAYRNGVLITNTAQAAQDLTYDGVTVIGSRHGTAGWWDGDIAYVRIHPSALTESQIKYLVQRLKGKVF